MTRKMLINATHPEELRVAIVEDGLLSELDIEVAGKEQTRGNIYKASVVRVESSLQAAFVDYGGERLGFLQLGEIHPFYYPSNENGSAKNRPRINEILRPGKELVVQVVKEERGTKGAALTTFLSLAGRYMVLMPESDSKGISRKIDNESDRKQLKQAMASLDLPENIGYIVRTAGIGKSAEELKRDFDYLVRIYRTIQERAREIKAPTLIFRESNLIIRCIRDYFREDMDEVLVDDRQVFSDAKDFFQMVMPDHTRVVKLHQEKRPIFSRYQIEEQIETISQNKVQLPSGGSIVLDSTEALVAVDVNSGKMATEQGLEATAYKTNMEAAAETARQLRLRDLGGLIVIDFIDMRDRKHIREVEKCLKEALASDKSRVTVGRISQFGLLEMSRQRLKPTLAAGSYIACPHCQGSGRLKSVEAQGVAFLRRIQTSIAKGQIGLVEGELPLAAALYLLNDKREELSELERKYDLEIRLVGRTELLPHEADLKLHKREKLPDKEDKEEKEPVLTPLEVAAITETVAEQVEEIPKEQAAALSEEENQVRKKRRRRRRPRKQTEEPPAAAAAGESAEKIEVADKESAPPQPTPAEPPAETPATEIAPAETAPVKADAELPATTPEAEEKPAAKSARPSRRGGRRPTRKTAAEATTRESTSAEKHEGADPKKAREEERGQEEARPPEAPSESSQQPPIRPSEVPASQTEQKSEPGPGAEESPPQADQAQPGAGKEKKPASAPARGKRTTPARKKTTQPAASENKETSVGKSAVQEAQPSSDVPTETTPAPPEAEKKAPARRKRTASSAPKGAADKKTAATEGASPAPATEADRSSSQGAAPSPDANGEADPAGGPDTASGARRKTAPRRRATPRAGSAAAKNKEPLDETGQQSPPGKPARKRTPRKKKDETEKAAKGSDKQDSSEEGSEK